MPIIQLTWLEIINAGMCGIIRRVSSMKGGLINKKHANKSDWDIDVDGACAEAAYAKYKNEYWSPTNKTFKAGDVGKEQIRSTCHDNGCLIVRPNDSADDVFVLVVTKSPNYKICGWIRGSDAKQEKYWRGDSWWVPQSDLCHNGVGIDGEPLTVECVILGVSEGAA